MSEAHSQSCGNGCLRRMDVEEEGVGNFSFYKGTLDCPAKVGDRDLELMELTSLCGCCSFDNGSSTKTPEDCRFRRGTSDSAACDCHNSHIVYATCLSKRNHGTCPYGLKGDVNR